MLRKSALCLLFLSAFLQQACITHLVMDDYAQYLTNNKNSLVLPKVDYSLSYAMDENSSKHIAEIRAFSTGYAHKWMIEFGKMLRGTMQSDDVKKAFRSVAEDDAKADIRLDFKMLNYDFTEHQAVLDIEVTLSKGQSKIFTKRYSAKGISQGGKMLLAGAFGMKNAIQQSTKSAMDDILKNLLKDIQSELKLPNT